MPPRPVGLVRGFHAAFGLGIGGRPAEISPVLAAHRQGLLGEEVAEVAEALNDGGLTNGAPATLTCAAAEPGYFGTHLGWLVIRGRSTWWPSPCHGERQSALTCKATSNQAYLGAHPAKPPNGTHD